MVHSITNSFKPYDLKETILKKKKHRRPQHYRYSVDLIQYLES